MDCHALTPLLPPAALRLQICDQLFGLSKLPDAVYFSRVRSRVNLAWPAISSWGLDEEQELMGNYLRVERFVLFRFKTTRAALLHLIEHRILVHFESAAWGLQCSVVLGISENGRAIVVISDRLEMELTAVEMQGLVACHTYDLTMERCSDEDEWESEEAGVRFSLSHH
jgi:hypothetical protein